MSDLTKRLREGGCGEYCDELEKEAADRIDGLLEKKAPHE